MTPIFKKLNFREYASIVCLHAPNGFMAELEAMRVVTPVHNSVESQDTLPFVMAFVQTEEEVAQTMQVIGSKLQPHSVVWFCYPKKSSKKYTATINRDQGWSAVAAYELEPVRQVSIDEDWSALRFKPVDQIKRMTRRTSMTLTEKGRNKTKPIE